MKPFYLLALFISILFVDFEKNNELKLPEHQKLNFKEGDILFQKLPEGELANAIVDITGSDYSHCGILVRNDSGVLVVVEAYIRVICMPLEAWIL